ncbi:MAG TPA: lytic transglycosylase domain-containing protein [Tenuifilaceae bacterium]|nr:lytic transglycosylase domain-containing protein [Tenuifilaceae bacterium]
MFKNRKFLGAAIALLAVATCYVFIAFIPSAHSKPPIEKPDTVLQDGYIFPIPIPQNLSFAGENVPLDYFDVRESLDRELQVNTFWHSQTVMLLKRANRYFPVIEPILQKNGIPDDFKYLAVAESGLMQVVSPSKAAGIWQILEGTGKDYGLEVNSEVDERYHVEKSTEVACRYLNKSYRKYGSWTMAAASYNYGQNGMDKQIDRQQGDSYYNMVLGEETGRYVYRILAIKIIFENPRKYGFFLDSADLYPPFRYREVSVDTAISSISNFARRFDTNYKVIKLFNPWLRESYLNNKAGKHYRIKIPDINFRVEAYAAGKKDEQ